MQAEAAEAVSSRKTAGAGCPSPPPVPILRARAAPLSTVQGCDRLFFLKDGRLGAVGTCDALLHTGPVLPSDGMIIAMAAA